MIKQESNGSNQLPAGYQFAKLLRPIYPIFPYLKRVERKLDDVVLPEVITFRQYLDKPRDEFFGVMATINPEKSYVQIIHGTEPKISIIDLAKTYFNFFDKDALTLLVFGHEDHDEIIYYFIRPANPYDLLLPPCKLSVKRGEPEWEKREVIEQRIQYLLSVYAGYADKIVFIGNKKSEYFNYEGVTHFPEKEIQHLFDLTPVVEEKNSAQTRLIKRYLIPLILPIGISLLFANYIPQVLLKQEQERFRQTRIEHSNLTKVLDKKQFEYKNMQDVIVNKKELYDN